MPTVNVADKLEDTFIKSLFKIESVRTDTAVFRLHYKLSSILIFFANIGFILLAFSHSSYISCVFPSGTRGSSDYRNNYCFVEHTFTVDKPEFMSKEEFELTLQREEISEGLRPVLSDDHLLYHRYYFWIPFILMIQTLLFYLPRYIWYTYEGGRLKMLAEGLIGISIDPEDRKDKKSMVTQYLASAWGYQQFYALMFALCEILNLAVVSLQMIFLHKISGGRFSSIGFEWVVSLFHGQRPEIDLVLRGFPLNTHCVCPITGPAGSVQEVSGFCTLALNMMSRRYFIFMWFYLSFLWICDIASILFRFLTLIRPQLRQTLLRWRACLAPEKVVRNIATTARYGDWFLIYQFGLVVDACAYADILMDLMKLLQESKMK